MFKFPVRFISWIEGCITTTSFSVKVNGALCGYFKGAKGLRQGDPLSPYLFVIAMEVLSIILSKNCNSPAFTYHWKTKDIQLTHLCFADDLLMFCHGDLSSVQVLKTSLDYFSAISGLCINQNKSQCFFSNVSNSTSIDIINCLGFQVGFLPIKFLGVPLISSKLSKADCIPLIHRIQSRITSWTCRFLSYAGRLQLIKSVLIAMQNFWAAHFILPAAVLNEISSILSRFLWRGNISSRSGIKVAWNIVSMPRDEGGLEIKSLKEWNKALILMHLWNIIRFKSTSFWSVWVKKFNIKGNNFWTMKIPSDCSWIWRKVLRLRPLAIQFINYHVGNGQSISIWFDPWLDHSPLAQSPTDHLIRNSGIHHGAKVSSLILNSEWSLPSSNHMDVIEFRRNFDYTRALNCDREDSILWGDKPENEVSANVIWHSIRNRGQRVPWAALTHHKMIPPRHSFHLWQSFHNALKTKDRLLLFGLEVDPICVLCGAAMESFHHLYFNCFFSFQVLFMVMRFCGWRGLDRNWSSITGFISSCRWHSVKNGILHMGFAAVVYEIWRERNARIYSQSRIPVRIIVKNILNMIKCKLFPMPRFHKVQFSTFYRRFVLNDC